MDYVKVFNHLVGEGDVIRDEQARLDAWSLHLRNFSKRRQLAREYLNNSAIPSLVANPSEARTRIEEIAKTIDADWRIISNSILTVEKVFEELKQLMAANEIHELTRQFVREKRTEENLLAIFREWHRVLKSELHLIDLALSVHSANPAAMTPLLQALHRLIFQHEAALFGPFNRGRQLFNPQGHSTILMLAHALILEREVKEDLMAAEERFMIGLIKRMGPASKDEVRRIAIAVVRDLWELVKRDYAGIQEEPRRMRDLLVVYLKQDILTSLFVRYAPHAGDVEIRYMVAAFIRAYNENHFSRVRLT